jgi:ankyrin repeat protein
VNVFPSAEYDLHVTEWHERPAIFTLIDGNNVQATKELLSRDPEQKLRKLSGNSEGWYPLHLAACLGQTRIMELLLSEPYNVDPNARSDMSRLTPLHQAVISQKPDAVELLLASGARVDAKYYIPYAKMLRDLTALEIALECCASDRCATLEDRRIVAILLHHGADYLRNSSGRGQRRHPFHRVYSYPY